MGDYSTSDFEKVLNKSAKKNMINWDLGEFKKSHPHLYKTIIESMEMIETEVRDECERFPNKMA